jgi:serine protease Do
LVAGDLPGLGAEVWALGAPLGVEFSLTNGRISAMARQVDPAAPLRLVQHDAAVNPGSSGGPLVDGNGALLGMNSQIADGSRMFVGIAYAISAPDLARIVQGLVEETLLPLPTLGLKARPMDRQLAVVLGMNPTGLLVDEVAAGGLAEAAGVQPGDVILSLGGQVLDQPGDLAFAVEAAQAKGVADMAVRRGDQMLLLPLSLETAEAGGVLALRDVAGAMPKKVKDYTLTTLGITLDGQGRVTDLTPNSPALLAGIALGDRIEQINGAVLTPDAIEVLVFDRAALFLVASEGHSRHVLIDPFSESHGFRPVGGANVLDPDVVVF